MMEVWSWRHAVQKSGLKSTTRFVLLNLSVYMNDLGAGCFPSIKRQAQDTGLSMRAVCEHLGFAVEAGFLRKNQHGYGDRRWARNEYQAQMPPNVKLMSLSENLPTDGIDAGSTPRNEACTLTTRGIDAGSIGACTQGQTNSSINSPKNSSGKNFILWKVLSNLDHDRAKRKARQVREDINQLSRWYEDAIREGKRARPQDVGSDFLEFISTFDQKRKRP
jgi:hypothetical protein